MEDERAHARTIGVSTQEFWSQGTLIQDEEFGEGGGKE